MAADTVSATRPTLLPLSAAARFWWAAAALFLLAGAARAYRLGADPLWLDEIITTDVAHSGYLVPLGFHFWAGLTQVLRNSLTDPHPPLYYLAMWLYSGFGALQAEWAWRLPSALAGARSVPALYALARRTTGDGPAWLAAAWLALNPTAVYFSQEARWPALTVLLVLLLTLAFSALLARPADRRGWAAYAGLAALALFTSYSPALVVGLQLPFALWAVRQQRGAAWLGLALVAALGLQAALAAQTLPGIAAEHSATNRPLLAADLLQSLLAGDVARYGTFWVHKFLVGPLLVLAGLGAWRAWRAGRGGERIYAALQVAAPLAAYALVAQPLLRLNLPNYEARQFLVLLPALYWLAAHGLAWLGAHLPRALAWGGALALSAVVVVGSAQGLSRYWTTTRSPEGYAAQYVAARLAPGDALVALDYFSRAALRYYVPLPPAYVRPYAAAEGLRFQVQAVTDVVEAGTPLAEVRAHPRLWVFAVPGRLDAHLAEVVAGCQVVETTTYPPTPIQVQLVTDCADLP